MTRTHRTCCCACGNKPCDGGEYRYSNTSGDCPICAIGEPTYTWWTLEIPGQVKNWDSEWIQDRHPDNLYVGNECYEEFNPGSNYPVPDECEWQFYLFEKECKGLYPMDPPELQFYQFASPWGFLPWAPQVMVDWKENWGDH